MGNYKGLVVSKEATNMIPLSRHVKTRTVTVVSGTTYTFSVRGTARGGSITLSGATTGAVTQETPKTFVAASTSLIITVTGYLKSYQLQLGSIATSDIWTSNSPVTRSADSLGSLANLQSGLKLGTAEGAVVINLSKLVSGTANTPYLEIIKTGSTAAQNSIRLVTHTAKTGIIKAQVYNNSVNIDEVILSNDLVNGGILGISWSASQIKLFCNGVLVHTINNTIPNPFNTISFPSGDYEVIYKGLYTFRVRPSDATMIECTNF